MDVKTNQESKTSEDETTSVEEKEDGPLFAAVLNAGTRSNKDKETQMASEQTENSAKSKKKKNPAYRLYTPATIQQHQFSSA